MILYQNFPTSICVCMHLLQCNIDPDTAEPLDELTPAAIEALTEIGCECTKVSEVLETKNTSVYEAIEEGIKRANKEAISNAQKVSECTTFIKPSLLFCCSGPKV